MKLPNLKHKLKITKLHTEDSHSNGKNVITLFDDVLLPI